MGEIEIKTKNEKKLEKRELTFPENRMLAFIIISVIAFAISFYLPNILKVDGIREIIFGILVLIAGIWFHDYILYIASVLTALYLLISYIDTRNFTVGMIIHAIVLLSFSLFVRRIGKTMISGRGEIVFEKELMSSILKSMGDGVIAVGLDNTIISMNRVAEEILGLSSKKYVGQNISKILRIAKGQEEFDIESFLAKSKKKKKSMYCCDGFNLINMQDEIVDIEGSISPIIDTMGNLLGVVLVFRNIFEKIKHKEEIKHLQSYDTLTNGFNRYYMEKQLDNLNEKTDYPISILIGDINNLKSINEDFGRSFGDHSIKETAKILENGVGKNGVVARWGGDEFVVLLKNTDYEEVENIVGNINCTCNNTKIYNKSLSIAFGWDTADSLSKNIEQVFNNAENYMYENKSFNSSSLRGRTRRMIMEALFEKSPRERDHSERVSYYCYRIAEALNMSRHEKEELRMIGLLHDIGKIIIKDDILEKKGKLTKKEFEEIKEHPLIGYRIINSSKEMSELAKGILAHHERWDGKGYPNGLVGESIPLNARIIAVADAYDAMISERPYGRIYSLEEAAQELLNNAGTQFDPRIVKIFAKKIIRNDIGLFYQRNTGQRQKVSEDYV